MIYGLQPGRETFRPLVVNPEAVGAECQRKRRSYENQTPEPARTFIVRNYYREIAHNGTLNGEYLFKCCKREKNEPSLTANPHRRQTKSSAERSDPAVLSIVLSYMGRDSELLFQWNSPVFSPASGHRCLFPKHSSAKGPASLNSLMGSVL